MNMIEMILFVAVVNGSPKKKGFFFKVFGSK